MLLEAEDAGFESVSVAMCGTLAQAHAIKVGNRQFYPIWPRRSQTSCLPVTDVSILASMFSSLT